MTTLDYTKLILNKLDERIKNVKLKKDIRDEDSAVELVHHLQGLMDAQLIVLSILPEKIIKLEQNE